MSAARERRLETRALRLTGRELDALHETLAVVLNDPDWFADKVSTGQAIARVSGKVVALLRAASAR